MMISTRILVVVWFLAAAFLVPAVTQAKHHPPVTPGTCHIVACTGVGK